MKTRDSQTKSSRARPQAPAYICITGASSGLGRALALEYAGPGRRLSLWGRNQERLGTTASLCVEKGAQVETVSLDLREFEAARDKLRQLDQEQPLDLVILAAGVISGLSPENGRETAADAQRVFAVNLLAVSNLAGQLLENMRQRGRGQLVFISSIAGLYPLPNSPAYSASKIAVSYYARALAAMWPEVQISCVYPGYLKTPMGRRLKARQPLAYEAWQAAALIRRRLEAGQSRIVFPRAAALGLRFLHLLPKALADRLCLKFGYRVEPDAESDAAAVPTK